MTDNSPSGVLKDNEEFITLLANQASAEVLDKFTGQFTPDDIQLRYLFLAQMLASCTERGQRQNWNVEFIKMMARHHGVDPDA
jgi:hypothetical protein